MRPLRAGDVRVGGAAFRARLGPRARASLSWRGSALWRPRPTLIPKGVVKIRTIRRKPIEKRWAPMVLKIIGGALRPLSDDDPEMGCGAKSLQISLEAEHCAAAGQDVHRNMPTLHHFGSIYGCPGCRSVIAVRIQQSHSEAHRKHVLTRQHVDSGEQQGVPCEVDWGT